MSSLETTPEVEVVPWKPKFDLDTPVGRVCMLSEKDIDSEFHKRYNIYMKNLGSYSRTLERYYELKTHEKFGTLSWEVLQETSKVSNYRVTNKEFIALGMEIISRKLASLPDELQHLEEQCFQPPMSKEYDALCWIYEFIYQQKPTASTVEIIARILQNHVSDFEISRICPHLCDMGKSDLFAYFISESVRHDKVLAEKRDWIIRQAAHRRALVQQSAMDMAKGDGPIYKVDIPHIHYVPERNQQSDSSTTPLADTNPQSDSSTTPLVDTKLELTPPTSGPQATRAPNSYTWNQFMRAWDDYFPSGVNKNRKNRKRSKRGGRSRRSW